MTPDEVQAFVGRHIEYQQAHDAEALAKLYTQDIAFHASGTHQGEFLGLPGTGKWVEFRAVFLLTLADDHIVHERRVYDFTGLLIKLGILKVKPT